MKKKSQSLSIFLLKQHVKEKEDAIQNISSLQNTAISLDGAEIFLYSKQSNKNKPSWVRLFTPYANGSLDYLYSSNCSAVLLINRNDRFFALTFGYGRHLLIPDSFEENFGLRVVVNSVDPEKLRSIDVHTLESVPVHKRSQASVSTSFPDFGLDVEQDLMYAATGFAKDPSFCKALSGKDALKISLPFELVDINSVLDKVSAFFESDSYKKSFPWIDRLSEVRNQSSKNELDEALVQKIKSQKLSKTWLAIPDVIDWANVSGFRYQKEKLGGLVDDISWDGYLSCLEDRKKEISIQRLKEDCIHCISASNEHAIHTWKVYRCIYCEIEHDGEFYSLTNGKWYKIDRDFLKSLDDEIGRIPVSDLDLPTYAVKSENEYNESVANSKGFVLMDRKNINYGNGSSKIEFCDLYSTDKKLIHVKRYGGSSVLSHLFSQGLVSMQLVLSDGNFRDLVNEKLPETHKLPKKDEKPNAGEFEVVYVIASNDKKTTAHDLPLFSKINLRSCYNRLQLMGVSSSLKVIPIEGIGQEENAHEE
ncbi:sporadically distributed protein, TIGR04141 family [Lysobacteraceae bacterium NML03-0222]|nr:sporadically distributed protein, TIGR04141 family [Xanthomonadaceae bacterium NML03-0222]